MQEFASKASPWAGSLNQELNCFKSRKLVRIMKIMVVILLGSFLQLSARGLSQNITLSVKDAPLRTVFKSIEKQTDYAFFFDEELLRKAKKVTVYVNNLPLPQVLDICFKGQPFTYTISGNTITLVRKNETIETVKENFPLKMANPILEIDVKGRIIDSNGEPISNATITVKGSSKNTVTNANGEFTLVGVDEKAVIIITHVQYESKEIFLNGKGVLYTALQTKVSSLDELQVIAYGTTTKRFNTGNVTTLKSSEIEKQPVQNPLLALQGRVPGLVVTQMTGVNGGAVQVRIQGQNSFRPTALEPLIVIDGIPYPSQFPSAYMETVVAGGSPLNYINPSDIESISVLKDADATAIYGSRAANGAILITTKKAKAGKPKLSIDFQQGFGKVTHFAEMMNTRQYLDMRYEAYKNDGINLATQSIGPSNYDLKLWDTTRYTDWQKELIGGTAQYTNINVGASGGSETVQYLIGANYNRQTTVFPGNFDNKAGGVHFNLNARTPNQRFHIQFSGSYIYNQNRLPDEDLTDNAILLEPDAPQLFNDNGTPNWAPNASGSSTWTNPLASTFATEFRNITKNLVSGANIEYAILPSLKVSSNFGYTNMNSDLFEGYKLEYVNPETRPYFQRLANFGKRELSSWIMEPQIQYSQEINKGKLDVLIGATLQELKGTYLLVEASGQPTNELLHSIASATSVRGVDLGTTGDYITKFNGLFGRIGYNWDKKYLVNLTGRRDGSSKFGDENKFHNFWSAGIGWIFSEEKWLQRTLPFLSFGKLRGSIGTTGNDQITDYSYLSLYNITNTNILYQGGTGFIVNGLSNPLLQWEETRKIQGGVDLAILNERIALGITYAHNRSSNQLIFYSLPDVTGFTGFTKNFPATIQNTSWEFSLNTINLKSKDITWTTNFNLTIPKNKVVNFPGIELTSYASGSQGVIIGDPLGIKKLYEFAGIDPATGSYMIFDQDGKPVPAASASTIQNAKVNLLPHFYGGLSNTLNIKRFQLDFLFQFVHKKGLNDLFYSNGSVPPGVFLSGYSNQPFNVLNRWQKPDDNSSIGRFTTNSSFKIWPSSTDEGYSYAAGSYIRLKNVSLSYQLPQGWFNKVHFQTVRIYFRGQNLATITKYKGLDPETRSISTLPPLQIWTIGAKIEL